MYLLQDENDLKAMNIKNLDTEVVAYIPRLSNDWIYSPALERL